MGHPPALRARCRGNWPPRREEAARSCFPAATTPWCWCRTCTCRPCGRWSYAGPPGPTFWRPSPSTSTTRRPASWCGVEDQRRHRAAEGGRLALPRDHRPVSSTTSSGSARSRPRTVVTVFIPEYVVGHWWEQLLHNQSALRLKTRLLFMNNVMVTSVPLAAEFVERVHELAEHNAPGDVRRGFRSDRDARADPAPATELVLTTGAAANGGSCVARHEGRVVFVRYALPGRRVRARVTGTADPIGMQRPSRSSSRRRTASTRCARSPVWTAPAVATWRSPIRRPPGGSRARWWPTSFARLGIFRMGGRPSRSVPARRAAGAPGCGWPSAPTGGRFPPLPQHRTGHRPALRATARTACSTGSIGLRWPPGDQFHVVLDDDGRRQACPPDPPPARQPWPSKAPATSGATRRRPGGGCRSRRSGNPTATPPPPTVRWWRTGRRPRRGTRDGLGSLRRRRAVRRARWRRWGTHRRGDERRHRAAASRAAAPRWPTCAGAGAHRLGAAALEQARRRRRRAVLDPPRPVPVGGGRPAGAGVPRVIHIGCEAAAFARDIGPTGRRVHGRADPGVRRVPR